MQRIVKSFSDVKQTTGFPQSQYIELMRNSLGVKGNHSETKKKRNTT